MAHSKPDYVLQIYNELAARGKFPKTWKKAQLILLRKGNKPISNPGSYRPICILDAEGNLCEQRLARKY